MRLYGQKEDAVRPVLQTAMPYLPGDKWCPVLHKKEFREKVKPL